MAEPAVRRDTQIARKDLFPQFPGLPLASQLRQALTLVLLDRRNLLHVLLVFTLQ